MTQTLAQPNKPSSVAERLLAARRDAGLSLEDAATASGLLPSYLTTLEDGRRRPLPREVQRLSDAYGADLSDLLPRRRAVEVDVECGRIAVGDQERRVRDLADDREVYAAYLFLLCTVRGAAPGERIPLRSSDVERLMAVVGDDAVTIERSLVQLMGCTPDEASTVREVLLRSRAVTAAVGAAAALSWVVVAAPGAPAEASRAVVVPTTAGSTPLSGGTSGASFFDADGPVGGEADDQPVQDEIDGTWSPSYPSPAGDGSDVSQ